MQHKFSQKHKPDVSKSLIIIKNQQSTLNKQQQAFNKLVLKIEKLRLELEQLNKILEKNLDFYIKNIYPIKQQLNELNIEMSKILYPFFKNKKLLSKKQKSTLGQVIASRLNAVFSFEKTEPADELKEIFKAVEGITYEEAMEEDFDSLKNEMENMFEDMGFDMNFDGMHSKMTEEEMILKSIEMQEQMEQQFKEKEKKDTAGKKTKKQLEKEERQKQKEEARGKSISSIYRQLAKVLHPDLERKEELKMQKEELMKQLTIAYENNDLHTLLSLELEWIRKQQNSPDNLTKSKLDIYNEVLREQVFELEQEIYEAELHPKYAPLQELAQFGQRIKSLNLANERNKLKAMVHEMSNDIAILKGNEREALAEVKAIIRLFEFQSTDDMEFSELFL